MAGGQLQRWARKARCFVSLNTSGVGQGTTQDFVIICSLEELFSWDSLGFGSELNHVRKVFLIVPIIIKEPGLASFLVLHGDNLALAWLLSRSDWNDLKAEVMAGLLANIPFSSTGCSVVSRHPRVFWLFPGKKGEKKRGKRPQLSLEMLVLLAGEQVIYCCSWHGSVSKGMSLGLAVFSWVLGTQRFLFHQRGQIPPAPHHHWPMLGEI